MLELLLETFHIREQRLIILGAEGQEILEGMSFAYSRLGQRH